MDKAAIWPLAVAMDENATALIALLGTRIGMIMEDVVDLALTLGAMDHDDLAAAIDKLDRSAATISALSGALRTIAI